MHRFTLPLSAGLSLCLLAVGDLPRAQAQKATTEKVHFETVDEVELQGTFWPSKKGRKAPCAILLHKFAGKGHNEDGWDKLAAVLQQQGFAVLAFDFRGHGASTTVGPGFWRHATNRNLVRRAAGPLPNAVDLKDFNPRYVPFLVNDIAAARVFLERKNDAGECNISDLVLIGAEEGAALGALWLASECHRYRVLPGALGGPPRLANKAECKDVIGCVWLSINPNLAKQQYLREAQYWVLKAGKDQRIPMAFVYGKEDTVGDRLALSMVQLIKPRYKRDSKMGASEDPKETVDFGVDKSKLVGSKLLTVGDASTRLGAYLNNIVERYGNNQWEKRESDKPPFVWTFNTGTVTAKNLEEKYPHPIPLLRFGIRP